MKKEQGFTLVEMMIVLFIISILLVITIPNALKHNESIQTKGCEALVHMVEAQVQAYHLDHQTMPDSVDELIDKGYLEEKPICPDGSEVVVKDGHVSVSGT